MNTRYIRESFLPSIDNGDKPRRSLRRITAALGWTNIGMIPGNVANTEYAQVMVRTVTVTAQDLRPWDVREVTTSWALSYP